MATLMKNVEILSSGSYRVYSMINGVRYGKTIHHEPTREEVNSIISSFGVKKRWTRPVKNDAMSVYFFENDQTHMIKIGVSNDVERRRKDIMSAAGMPISVIGVIPKKFRAAFRLEQALHVLFEENRIVAGGMVTEWFDSSVKPKVLDYLSREE